MLFLWESEAPDVIEMLTSIERRRISAARVYFAGEIVGEGIGRTRREAQHQAAEAALMHLAGLSVDFRVQPVVSDSGEMDEVYAEVEVDGQILGKGFGSTSEEAKAQAAEKALASLTPMIGRSTPKRPSSPW
ncbi:hypothetical protein Droror1_Dr00016417 [Drosera rotundifolia]